MLRSTAATAALASLGLGFAAVAQTLLAGPPDAQVEVEADRITYAWEPPVIHLDGHVVARRGGGLLRAGSGMLDRTQGILKLEGGVLGIQGRQVFYSDSAIVDLNAHSAEMSQAVLFLKALPANPDAPRSGANALILRGRRARQLPNGHYVAENVTLTPCDCAGEPDYELLAETAELDGDRVHARGVNLRLLGATLPLFPLSLPLTSRQSGLLAPQPGGGATVGFAYAQPIFFTLGPSYDVTIAPGIYTGGSSHQETLGGRSVKGPRLNLEGRYAPVPGTAGLLAFDTFYDLDQHDGGSAGRGFGGVRGIGHLNHRTEADAGIFAVQGLAASDVMVVRDLVAQSLGTADDLFTTDAGFWRARGPLTLGADATLIQDMRIGPEIDRHLFGPGSGATMQRLPAVFAQVAPIPLGPATLSIEASAVHYTRFGEPSAAERSTGFGPTDLQDRSTPLPALPSDGSRAPTLRFDLSPRVAFSGSRSLPVDLRLEAGARVDGWLMEGFSDRDRARAYALVDARAGIPLERLYGGTLHRIEPALRIRALSRHLQSGGPPVGDPTDAGGASYASAPNAAQQGLAPGGTIAGVPAARRTYDEIDFAAPVTGAVQVTASLSQSLWRKPGRTPGRILQFDLLQDALLWTEGGKARVGEASAVAGTQLGPGNLGAFVRYDWALHQVSAINAGGGVRDARGDEVHAGVNFLRGSSSERLRAGIDELFSTARFAVTPTALTGNAGAGFSAPLPHNLRLGYEVSYTPGDLPAELANFVHTAVVSVDTPCRCLGLQFLIRAQFHDGHFLGFSEYHLVIDLKSLGSFATF